MDQASDSRWDQARSASSYHCEAPAGRAEVGLSGSKVKVVQTEKTPNPGWFKKGTTLNPRGRPKINRDLREWLQRQEPRITRKVFELMDGPDPGVALQACKLLYAYALGTPVARTEIAGANGGPVQMLAVVADLEQRLAERAKRLGIACRSS